MWRGDTAARPRVADNLSEMESFQRQGIFTTISERESLLEPPESRLAPHLLKP
jgi:hypothetical protein